MKIYPTILTDNPGELTTFINRCVGVVNRVQIDINDGSYLGVRTIDPEVLNGIDTSLFLDFHLMVADPINWVEKCAHAGADRTIAQVEGLGSQIEFIQKVQETGAKVGLALNISTPIDAIDHSIINDLDVVLLMDYEAGHGGQEFNSLVIQKIEQLSKLKAQDSTPFSICCDGGMWEDTLPLVNKAGADEAFVGRRIFEGDLANNISCLSSKI